jgi:hypothetical protein
LYVMMGLGSAICNRCKESRLCDNSSGSNGRSAGHGVQRLCRVDLITAARALNFAVETCKFAAFRSAIKMKAPRDREQTTVQNEKLRRVADHLGGCILDFGCSKMGECVGSAAACRSIWAGSSERHELRATIQFE